jgi:hypothetical protein
VAEKGRLEFFLLRYAPNILSQSFVNIGIVLLDPAAPQTGFCDVRFIGDWQRLRSFDEDADIEMLRAMASDIKRQLMNPTGREERLHSMEDSFSTAIQLSPRQECVTDNPLIKLEDLSVQYLFPIGDTGTEDVA